MLGIFFQRVLTAEFVDACKVDDVEGLKQRGLDVADVSTPAITRLWDRLSCEEKATKKMASDTIFLALTLALRKMFRINTYVYLRNYSRWHLAGEIPKTWLLASVKWILKNPL